MFQIISLRTLHVPQFCIIFHDFPSMAIVQPAKVLVLNTYVAIVDRILVL